MQPSEHNPSNGRKGYTLIPPGQHPGVPKINVPDVEQQSDVRIESDDPMLRNAMTAKPNIPSTDGAVKRVGFHEQELPPAEPILDEDPRDVIDTDTAPEEIVEREDAIDADPILNLAGYERPATHLDRIRDEVNKVFEDRDGLGIDRNTTLSNFVTAVAEGKIDTVDTKRRKELDQHMIETISAHATVETVIRDLGNAISEQGAKIMFNVVDVETMMHGIVHLSQLRKVIKMYGLDEYEHHIILDQLDKLIGRSKTLEAEHKATDRKHNTEVANIMMLLSEVVKSIRELDLEPGASKKPSPFIKEHKKD